MVSIGLGNHSYSYCDTSLVFILSSALTTTAAPLTGLTGTNVLALNSIITPIVVITPTLKAVTIVTVDTSTILAINE